jgi:hypothetical protein
MDCIENTASQYKVCGPAPSTYTIARTPLESEEGRVSAVQSSKGHGGGKRHIRSSTAVMLIEDVFQIEKDCHKEGGADEINKGFLE